ncbi:MAG: glycosyltransferase family 39 protein, partial [Cyanobacteria bacterium CAN_BIN43]|nr:glycosyltransferase family 39 protein [Cyanobacteria bacterium CAN_BIN43]
MLQLDQSRKAEAKPQLRRSRPRWLQICAIALLVIGIFFRFYNLDRKVYWLDEARTSLRMSGHTQTELVKEIYTGQVVTAATLQTYQRPGEKSWGDTLHALKGNAEHTPLYFLLARLWTEGFGYSVANIRGLSVFFSLLVFPCLFWLCRELFASNAVGWMAIALVSITPLHVLYAQEARLYSLWTVKILLSSAILLWAMRTKTRWSWVAYGISLTLG